MLQSMGGIDPFMGFMHSPMFGEAAGLADMMQQLEASMGDLGGMEGAQS